MYHKFKVDMTGRTDRKVVWKYDITGYELVQKQGRFELDKINPIDGRHVLSSASCWDDEVFMVDANIYSKESAIMLVNKFCQNKVDYLNLKNTLKQHEIDVLNMVDKNEVHKHG